MFLETIGLKIVKLDKIENWTKLKIGQNCKLDKIEKVEFYKYKKCWSKSTFRTKIGLLT